MFRIHRDKEKLHRLEAGQNDWDNVPEEELTRLQRIAKVSHGVLTLGNLVTVFGSALMMDGAWDFVHGKRVEGIIKGAGGAFGDYIDGWVANHTHTKGRFGRDLDPTFDFIKKAVSTWLLATHGVLPPEATAAVAVPLIANSTATVAAKVRGREILVEEDGKNAEPMALGGFGGFMTAVALGQHAPHLLHTSLEVLGYAGTNGSAFYRAHSTLTYLRVGFGNYVQNFASSPSQSTTLEEIS